MNKKELRKLQEESLEIVRKRTSGQQDYGNEERWSNVFAIITVALVMIVTTSFWWRELGLILSTYVIIIASVLVFVQLARMGKRKGRKGEDVDSDCVMDPEERAKLREQGLEIMRQRKIKAEENRYKDAQMKSLKLGITLKRLLIFVIVTFIILFVIGSCVYMLESGI